MLAEKEIIFRLLLAALFGALIGLERERKHWAAGLRTHMMVCVGSCLVIIVSAFGFAEVLPLEHVSFDPSRIAAQVVSGIGFIGAGTILFSKEGTIRGLTTAAGLWTVAAIGLATGSGLYFAAGATTVIALVILWALQPLERFYINKFSQKKIKIIARQNLTESPILKNITTHYKLKIQTFSFDKDKAQYLCILAGENLDWTKLNAIIDTLKDESSVQEITLEQV